MPVAFVDKGGFIQQCLGIACGVLGWAPDTFWRATPFDVLAAWKGYARFYGLEQGSELTNDDVQHLRKILDRFPDK